MDYFKQKSAVENEEDESSLQMLLARLLQLCKQDYKRHLLLEGYFKAKAIDSAPLIDLTLGSLNIAKTSHLLNAINLFDNKHFVDLKKYLADYYADRDDGDTYTLDADQQLTLSVTYSWSHVDRLYRLLLINLTRMVKLDRNANLLVDLSCDLCSVPFLAKHLTSPCSPELVNQFLLRTIYSLCTGYFYRCTSVADDVENYLAYLVTYSERFIDTPCFNDLFAASTATNSKLTLADELEKLLDPAAEHSPLLDSSPNKFLLFVLTTLNASSQSLYTMQMLKLLNRLFSTGQSKIVGQLNQLITLNERQLERWLEKLLAGLDATNNHRVVLRQLFVYLVVNENINESVCLSLLNRLVSITSRLVAEQTNERFVDSIILMDLLCASGSGAGYLRLFDECAGWLEHYSTAKTTALNNEAANKSASYVLSYVCDILNVVKCTLVNGGKVLPGQLDETTGDLNKIIQKKLLIDFNHETLKLVENTLTTASSVTTINECCIEHNSSKNEDDQHSEEVTGGVGAGNDETQDENEANFNDNDDDDDDVGGEGGPGDDDDDDDNNDDGDDEDRRGMVARADDQMDEDDEDDVDEDMEENFYDDLNNDDTYNDLAAGASGTNRSGTAATAASGPSVAGGEKSATEDDDDEDGYYDFDEKVTASASSSNGAVATSSSTTTAAFLGTAVAANNANKSDPRRPQNDDDDDDEDDEDKLNE